MFYSPPFSHDQKKKCLERVVYLWKTYKKPACLLMPIEVQQTKYFRECELMNEFQFLIPTDAPTFVRNGKKNAG